MSGVIPAIPLIIIRPFLPESPVWRQKKLAGTLKRPSIAELFSPAVPPHDDRDDGDDGDGVRRGVRRHPADPADRARPARGAGDGAGAAAQARLIPEVRPMSPSQEVGGLAGRILLPSSPRGSSAAAS